MANSIFDSPLFKNLEEGKLPEVEVTLQPRTIVNLAVSILIVSVIVILLNYLILKR